MSDQENQWMEKAWKDFSSKLLHFILKKGVKPYDAEDILQNVFVKVATHLDSFDRNSNLNAWLFSITRNEVINHFRRQQNTTITDSDLINSTEIIANEETDICCCLESHIEQLPEKYSSAILLSDIQGKKHKEIAENLGLSISAIKSRVVRGRELLKDLFVQCCKYKMNDHRQLIGEPDCESPHCSS